jgi:hypothetical protein
VDRGCLPAEYKPKFIKSELSSLSKQLPKRQLAEVAVVRDQISSQESDLLVADMQGRHIPDEADARLSFQSESVQTLSEY